MSGTYPVSMGDRGRLVVPAELRERAGLTAGTPLILAESTSGLVIMTRDQAHDRLRQQLEGHDLVGELLAERRRTAATEDSAA
ncbi:AbrB/MazE/SpoVT family DNA-binding domain-containing protein [Georgenia sp. MJ173]|uniref:AbrB/MazE/SpoVT family DNA-binding domain-containing protein n=1 Tax=Georgenia sunbinii TaxID=3117728 RepID=UPI002F265AB6